MGKFVVGDLVRFKSDRRFAHGSQVYEVLAVSDVYDMVQLRNYDTGFIISWYPVSYVRRVSVNQPELTSVEV